MYQFFPNNTGEAMLHKNSVKKKKALIKLLKIQTNMGGFVHFQ